MSWGEKNGIPLLRVPLVQNFLTQVTFMPPWACPLSQAACLVLLAQSCLLIRFDHSLVSGT